MNKRIRSFTLITIMLVATIFSINFARSTKYFLTNANSETYSEVIDFNEEVITQTSQSNIEKLSNNQNSILLKETEQSTEIAKPLKFSWPCRGNIIVKFSPSEIIYDEILDQYRTSNGIILKTQDSELNSMCDGKIVSILTNGNFEKEITIKTTENHTITIKGNFDNLIQKEGNIILKGNKIGNIKLSNEFSYVYITAMKDNVYIDPVELIS